MNSVGFDAGVDPLGFQAGEEGLDRRQLHGYLAAGEGNAAAVKEHEPAAQHLIHQFVYGVGRTAVDPQTLGVGAPGTMQIAPLQMIDKPIAGSVL